MSDDPMHQVRERRLLINKLDEWLYAEIEPYLGKRIMEVGSGHGNMIKHLLNRELVVATDCDVESVGILQAKFNRQENVKAFVHDICAPVDPALLELELDTVVSLNVFEHIEDDMLAMSNVAKILQPGGYIVLIVPAHMWLYGTMDSSIGHFRRYTKQSMGTRLGGVGFVVVKQFYVNTIGALGWWFNGRILHNAVPPRDQLAAFNHMVSLMRGFEERIRPPVGLSLVTVGRLDMVVQ